ncbi:MFS transporter [Polymorphobacter sp.]|uniref:MFS transporter n=1 Tax=Polymorphobacter sp. TaxID=1909290 RepID=UPI003F72777B
MATEAPGIAVGTPGGHTRWVMIALTFMVAAVAYLDRSNIAIAAPLLKEELGLSNVQLGVVFSAFSFGYAATQPIAGRLADRFGAYRIIAAGVIIWSVLTAVTASIPAGFGLAFMTLLVVRFALGVGEAVIFPASNRMVANWMPSSERGLANGLIFAGVGVGAGVAPPLITTIMLTHDWRAAFWATAAIGLVALLLWLLMARETPARHPWASNAERAYIEAGMPERRAGEPARASWGAITGNRTVQLLIFSYFCFGYAAYIFFTWFFTYLSTVRGLDLKSSGIYGTLPFIAMAVASPVGGWIADRLTVRHGGRVGRSGVAGVGMVLAALFIAAATQVEDVRVVAAVLALGSGSLYLAQSAFWTLSADIGRSSAGAVSGVMNMGSQIGGAAVALLTPVLAESLGWSVSFLFTAGVCLAGGLAWAFIDPDATLKASR